jgi:hypothetical protein
METTIKELTKARPGVKTELPGRGTRLKIKKRISNAANKHNSMSSSEFLKEAGFSTRQACNNWLKKNCYVKVIKKYNLVLKKRGQDGK